MYLDFLFNAQGEDVVAGHRSDHSSMHLETVLPEVMVELHKVRDLLETLFSDMQDFEFTVENERLYLLQTRRGNRTPWAGLKIAMDFYREGAIDEQAVMERLQDYDLDTLERTSFAPPPGSEPLTRATPASIGSVVGSIALSPARAIEMAQQGQAVILVRESTATEDISGIAAAQGLLTARRISHLARIRRCPTDGQGVSGRLSRVVDRPGTQLLLYRPVKHSPKAIFSPWTVIAVPFMPVKFPSSMKNPMKRSGWCGAGKMNKQKTEFNSYRLNF